MLGVVGIVTVAGAIAIMVPGNHAVSQQATTSELQAPPPVATVNNGGMTSLQIIEIAAKGGYTPNMSVAKADTPTLIKIKSDSTFDCSAVLVIPALDYRTRLPMTGVTSINVPPQAAGTELTGLCAMGMYRFTVKFVG